MAANDPLILKRNAGDTGFEEVSGAANVRDALGAPSINQVRGLGRARMVELYTDFYGSASGNGTDGMTFLSDSSGAGSGLSFLSVDRAAGEFGIISISTGTTTTGRGLINPSNTSQLPRFDDGPATFETKARIPVLSDATDEFTVFQGGRATGLSADTGGNDAFGFRYHHGTNGGRWLAVTRSNGSETSQDTGVAPTANVWQIFRIEVNATGTSVGFYIDGVLVATLTSNIQVLNRGRLQHGLLKAAGTTARTLEMDYVYFRKEFTASR